MTANDRARLYVAFGAINKYEGLKQHKADPETAVVLAPVNAKRFEDDATAWAKEVGHEWTARFRKPPRTYSGLRLRQLVTKLGPEMLAWYTKVYGEQSKVTHATDFLKHATYSESEGRFVAKWFPTFHELRRLLGINGAMLWGCLDLLNQQFRFDGDTDGSLQLLLSALGRILEA